MSERIDPHDPERLARNLDKSGGPDACWPWQGDHTPPGYGMITVYRESVRTRYYTHRIAYEIEHGPVPEGLHVLHRCDNPPCCNPKHLFTGTNADNVADMDAKGRRINVPHLGEDHGMAKLTEADVRAIRDAFAAGEPTIELGPRFGISRLHVYSIVNRTSWKHIV